MGAVVFTFIDFSKTKVYLFDTKLKFVILNVNFNYNFS